MKIKLNRISKISLFFRWFLIIYGVIHLIASQNGFNINPLGGFIVTFIGLFHFLSFNYLTVDKRLRKIIHKKGILFFTIKSTAFDMDKIKNVGLSIKSVRKFKKRYPKFPIKFIGIKNSVIISKKNLTHSRAIAKQIAYAINVPLKNTIYNKVSILPPSDLWTPLTEKWKKAGVVFDSPVIPKKTNLEITNQEGVFEVIWKTDYFGRKYAVIALIFFIAIATIVILNTSNKIPWFILFGTFIMGLLYFVLLMSGKSGIKINKTAISQKVGMLGWRNKIILSDIQEYIVSNTSINLVGDKVTIGIDWTKSKEDNEYLEAIIPYQLQRF